MIDPIQAAIAKAKGVTATTIADVQNQASELRGRIPTLPALPSAASAASSAQNRVSELRDRVPQLPTVKDPELLKKQAEAQAQALIADQKQKLLETKDNAVNQLNAARSRASSAVNAAAGLSVQALGAKALSSISTGKLPKLQQLSDAKVLAALNVAKKIKELAKERKKLSTENLTKAKDAFKYPITKIAPELPQLPRLTRPEVPNLPFNL